MDFDIIFEKFKNTSGKNESLFTIVIYNLSVEQITQLLEHQLRTAKNIINPKKRTVICKKIYQLKEFIKDYKKNKLINSIFLVDNTINEIELNKDWLDVLKYFDVQNFIFKCNNFFEINFLKSLLTDVSYENVICVNNNKLTHTFFNKNKKRVHFKDEIKSLNIEKYINDNCIKDRCLIHGVSVALKNFKTEIHLVYNKLLKDDEILEIFRRETISKKQNQLQSFLDFMDNDKLEHRLIFGKDVHQKLLNMELKFIFCSPRAYNEIIKQFPKIYLNFDLIEVESLENGDVGDILKNKYDGAIGITYY